MSYFKAILAVIITFHTSSSFGMDSFWQWLNKQEAKTYFEPELQKTLTLIMLKNRGQEPFNQDSDVLKIIAKNSYHLYCDELLQSTIETDFFKDFWGKGAMCSFEGFWKNELSYYSDSQSLNIVDGQKIEINDFDFITLSNQGRKIFRHTLENGRFLHDPCWMMQDCYNDLLKLPLSLRSKIGNLCVMSVGRKEIPIIGNIVSEIKPVVPEKYTEILTFKEKTEKQFQPLKENLIHHQQKTAIKFITQE